MKWLFREYMTKKHIASFKELSRDTGIEYRTLMNHIADINQFRVYEIKAICEALGLEGEDMLEVVKELLK